MGNATDITPSTAPAPTPTSPVLLDCEEHAQTQSICPWGHVDPGICDLLDRALHEFRVRLGVV